MRRGVLKAVAVALGVGAAAAMVATIDVAWAQEGEQERRPFARVLALAESGAWLGVAIEDVDAELADELGLPGVYGVRVESVVEEGPAAESGLQEDDVIVRWNDERVESVAELRRHLRETPAGRTVTLGVIRAGSERELEVELGDRGGRMRLVSPRPLRERALRMPHREVFGGVLVTGRGRLGVGVQSLGEQLADYFGVEGGALVTSVSDDSPAAEAGLRAGDVIVGIADEDVEDPGDLIEALRERGAGPVTVRIVRERQEREVTVELEERMRRGSGAPGRIRVWTDDGPGAFRFESFEVPEIEIGPMDFEGFRMEPGAWRFDLDAGEWGDPEPIEVRIPRIHVPAFDLPAIRLPAIEVPGFEVEVPAAPRAARVLSV